MECDNQYSMTVSTANLSSMVVMLYVVLAPSFVHLQIPTACADAESLRTLTCCPNQCGAADGDSSQQQILPFRSIQQLTDEEWRDYIDIIKMTKTYPSEYKAVLDKSPPGTTDLRTTDTDLYYLFIWVHFHASKDLRCKEGNGMCHQVQKYIILAASDVLQEIPVPKSRWSWLSNVA